jgi:uncharacterized protein
MTMIGTSRCSNSLENMPNGYSLYCGTSPVALPGWDNLAGLRSFYVGMDWLRFCDRSRISRSAYWGLTGNNLLLSALSAHWTPAETNASYIVEKLLPTVQNIQNVLTLGGRRGYLSAALTHETLSATAAGEAIAELIGAAAAAVPESRGMWWWPYLLGADAQLVKYAASLISNTGAGAHLVDADCSIELAGDRLDDHIESLPAAHRRTKFRREARKFLDMGLQIKEIPLKDNWMTLGPLLANVQQKYGHSDSEDDMKEYLFRQAELLNARSVVFGCYAGDTLVGFSLGYRWGNELAMRVLGLDYCKLPGGSEYAALAVHAPLNYCYRHGLRHLHLGIDSYEAKIRRGAKIRPLWAITSWAGPDRIQVESTMDRLSAEFPEREAALFRSDVVSQFQKIHGIELRACAS